MCSVSAGGGGAGSEGVGAGGSSPWETKNPIFQRRLAAGQLGGAVSEGRGAGGNRNTDDQEQQDRSHCRTMVIVWVLVVTRAQN